MKALKRHLVELSLVAIFALFFVTGCNVSVYNGADIPGNEKIHFSGFAGGPNISIEIFIKNQARSSWVLLQTTRSSSSGMTINDDTLYSWSTIVNISDLSDRIYGTETADGTCFQFKTREAGSHYLAVFDEGGVRCTIGKINGGESWVVAGYKCMSSTTPVVSLYDRLYGPPNEWWHVRRVNLPAGLHSDTLSVGSVAPNFNLIDQNGDEVELYQFYGRVIVIKLFAQ